MSAPLPRVRRLRAALHIVSITAQCEPCRWQCLATVAPIGCDTRWCPHIRPTIRTASQSRVACLPNSAWHRLSHHRLPLSAMPAPPSRTRSSVPAPLARAGATHPYRCNSPVPAPLSRAGATLRCGRHSPVRAPLARAGATLLCQRQAPVPAPLRYHVTTKCPGPWH